MKVLIVAATPFEIAPLRARWEAAHSASAKNEVAGGNAFSVNFLVTGIGMVNTAFCLGSAFARDLPDVAVNLGIGGAFVPGPALGSVVEVVEECYPELGADSPQGFLPLEALGFANFTVGETPVYNVLAQPRSPLGHLPACKAVTVNRVSGEPAAIAALQARWQPEVESMEGAAFFQACLRAGVPFRQLRAISNHVEARNRAAWNIPAAIEALNLSAFELLTLAQEQCILL